MQNDVKEAMLSFKFLYDTEKAENKQYYLMIAHIFAEIIENSKIY